MSASSQIADRAVYNELLKNVTTDMLAGEQYLRRELHDAAEKDATIGNLKKAHDFMRERFHALKDAMRSPDPTMTPDANYLEMKKRADAVIDQAAKTCSEARTGGEKMVASIDNDIAVRTRLVEGPRAAEIRAHIRQKKVAERVAFLEAAIGSDDIETLGAVFSGPAYLSGLEDKTREVFLSSYRRKVAGDLVERRATVQLAMEINNTTFNDFLNACSAVFPKGRTDEIAARVNAVKAKKDAVWGL